MVLFVCVVVVRVVDGDGDTAAVAAAAAGIVVMVVLLFWLIVRFTSNYHACFVLLRIYSEQIGVRLLLEQH